jgi:hypothetical protein
MSCDAFVLWKLCAIVIIAFLTIILKLVGQLLDHLLSGAGGYTTAAWFVSFAVSLGIGALFQKKLNVRNMWKNPFGGV